MNDIQNRKKIFYHLPGLFEFYDFYAAFLPLYRKHREYFYDWCEIGSIYGAPADCIWGGGRVGYGENDPEEVSDLMNRYHISSRLTFSNSLLTKEHLADRKCNDLCRLFQKGENGIIIHSDLLLTYLKENYPSFYFVSSTTKVLTDFRRLKKELSREDFRYVVADFRLNKNLEQWTNLPALWKDKVEFLCNECCDFACRNRKQCYESVSKRSLGEADTDHICSAPGAKDGYRFSKAMKHPAFISVKDIQDIYMPMGFSHFKIEGRSLGSALILEFLLYYMTRPEYHIHVREEIYLDNTLDLF